MTLDLYRVRKHSSSPNPIFGLNEADGVFNFRQYAEQEANHSCICSLQQNTVVKLDTVLYLGSKLEDKSEMRNMVEYRWRKCITSVFSK